MKIKRFVLDQEISTCKLREPFPFGERVGYVADFFRRVSGLSSISVGNVCNQRCIYCDTPRDDPMMLAQADAEQRVDRIAALGISRIMFLGGEPTIWRPLAALVARARERGVAEVFIATNGLMLSYPRYLQELVDAGLTGVQLSLDDFHPETMRVLSSHERADELVLGALENLLGEKRLWVYLNAVVTKLNRGHLPDFVARLEALSARRGTPVPAVLSHLKPITFAYDNRDVLVEPVSVAAPAIVAAVSEGMRRGMHVIHKGLPACQTPGFEAYGWEANLVEHRVDMFTAEELPSVQSPMLAKGPGCADCRWGRDCEGVYRNYVDQFGWDELRPVRPPAA